MVPRPVTRADARERALHSMDRLSRDPKRKRGERYTGLRRSPGQPPPSPPLLCRTAVARPCPWAAGRFGCRRRWRGNTTKGGRAPARGPPSNAPPRAGAAPRRPSLRKALQPLPVSGRGLLPQPPDGLPRSAKACPFVTRREVFLRGLGARKRMGMSGFHLPRGGEGQ